VRLPEFGEGTIDQEVPSHRRINVLCQPRLLIEKPTAQQSEVDEQATDESEL
jgi:hypothetical protein